MLKKRLVSLAASAVALVESCAAVPAPAQGRHILLGAGDGGGTTVPGLTRFFSQVVELAEGTTQSWVTITRTGNFTDPRYGNFQITPTHLDQMVTNFNARVLGQEVFLDVAHRPNDGAAGKFVRLSVENGRLRGLVEWTAFGVAAVKERGFAYLSAEYHEAWTDNEKQQPHGCVLLGAGLTTRPVIKHLEPVLLSLDSLDADQAGMRVGISHQLLKELTENATMNYLDQLKAKLLAMGLAADVVTKLLAQAKTQFDAAATDAVKSLALVDTWAAAGQQVADQIRALSTPGAAGAGGAGTGAAQPITITLAQPGQAADVGAEVARVLAERDATAAQTATTLAANVRLLSETIAAGDTTLQPDGVTALAQEFVPLVSATSTETQVKALAQIALQNHQRVTAAARLSGMGYVPVGNARIEVGTPQTVKALQTEMDRRLGLDRLPDAQRYFGTGGQLLAANRQFAERALAQFDAEHGAQLHAEHRMLSGGQGSVSDVAVPVAAERTVLREALYNLQSLAFVNVGTAPFANVITVPYSYRDTAAAGAAALRRYEGQGIRRAGVIQTQEEARPIPQKLAFSLSAEMRLLMSASLIDFDPVAENVRNIIRIVGEDTEALNMNELVCSADEFGVVSRTDTLTATVNGTNSVFVTSQFPVVRPRKVYDLKGAQVGSTTNPITVTLNAVARTEFVVNADGSALAAGTYWVMDYNLGELRFVTQDGAPVVPTNGWALTVAYSYTTNAVKWNTDAVVDEDVKDRYDRLLTTVGGRKAVISADRYYTPNMLLMSATVDNAVSQARSFEANASRVATGLAPDGSVGQVKGIATFNTSAPGLLMGDSRILVGERGNCRFRMVKPFAMNPLEQQRDANGRFTDGQEGFGTQWVVSHTPTQLKNSLTSVVLYSATGRVARA